MVKNPVTYSDYFGFLKRAKGLNHPEDSYVLTRYGEGTWLLRLSIVKNGCYENLGTVDLLEILDIANKSHFAILRKDEFYDALEKLFGIDFSNKLYADPDVEKVMKRVNRHSTDVAIDKKIKKEFFQTTSSSDN